MLLNKNTLNEMMANLYSEIVAIFFIFFIFLSFDLLSPVTVSVTVPFIIISFFRICRLHLRCHIDGI